MKNLFFPQAIGLLLVVRLSISKWASRHFTMLVFVERPRNLDTPPVKLLGPFGSLQTPIFGITHQALFIPRTEKITHYQHRKETIFCTVPCFHKSLMLTYLFSRLYFTFCRWNIILRLLAYLISLKEVQSFRGDLFCENF